MVCRKYLCLGVDDDKILQEADRDDRFFQLRRAIMRAYSELAINPPIPFIHFFLPFNVYN